MKRIIFALYALYPLLAIADIIVTRSNGNIEDVTVVSVNADEVAYQENGTQKTLATSDIEGVLYDDGRYITPPSKQSMPAPENAATADDSWSMNDAVENSTKRVATANTHADNRVVYDILFADKTYSKECRKAGERVFNEMYVVEEQKLKKVRKSMTREERKAADAAVLEKAIKASNDAVLECSGIKNNNNTQSKNESSW